MRNGLRNCHAPLLLGIVSAAAQAQPAPTVEGPAPAGSAMEPRPPSFYASSAAPATSALVHEQAAAFWGPVRPGQFLDNPLQWGPFEMRPFASYRFSYGNGLNASPGQQETTALHEITPGAVLQSRHLSFSYAPTLKYYSSAAFEDGLDHNVSANGHFAVGDWTFALSYVFSKTSSPLIETGTQTPQQSHSTTLTAHYQQSQEISYDFTLSQSIQKADELNNSRTW